MYSGNMWLSYEDQTSITDKANLANKYNLGGVMTWALHQDDYDGVCSSCKWPLLSALSVAAGRISASAACKTSNSSPASSGVTPTTRPTVPPNNSGNNNTSGTTLTNCGTVGLLAHPSDCSKYLSCASAGAKPFVMSCSSGLKWNNQAKICDWNCVP